MSIEKPQGATQEPIPVGSSELVRCRWHYTHLGNLSAVEPWAQVTLYCDVCQVKWLGCMDAAACPKCGDHKDWDELMESSGHYRNETPKTEMSDPAPKADGIDPKAQAGFAPSNGSAELVAVELEHSGVWCCQRRHNCKWQGFALYQGLAWGEIPTGTSWRKYHDLECGGKLIQLVPPND